MHTHLNRSSQISIRCKRCKCTKFNFIVFLSHSEELLDQPSKILNLHYFGERGKHREGTKEMEGEGGACHYTIKWTFFEKNWCLRVSEIAREVRTPCDSGQISPAFSKFNKLLRLRRTL